MNVQQSCISVSFDKKKSFYYISPRITLFWESLTQYHDTTVYLDTYVRNNGSMEI